MSELPFVNDLRRTLTLLGPVLKDIRRLEIEKEKYREQIRDWLEMNNLDEYEVMDSNNEEVWRMGISSATRRSTDYDYLESVLTPEQQAKAITKTSGTSFKCGPVKSRKKKKKEPAQKPAPTVSGGIPFGMPQ